MGILLLEGIDTAHHYYTNAEKNTDAQDNIKSFAHGCFSAKNNSVKRFPPRWESFAIIIGGLYFWRFLSTHHF